MINYLSLIETYYLKGYGVPRKFYTEKNLENFVKKGMISQEQMNELVAKKKKQQDQQSAETTGNKGE